MEMSSNYHQLLATFPQLNEAKYTATSISAVGKHNRQLTMSASGGSTQTVNRNNHPNANGPSNRGRRRGTGQGNGPNRGRNANSLTNPVSNPSNGNPRSRNVSMRFDKGPKKNEPTSDPTVNITPEPAFVPTQIMPRQTQDPLQSFEADEIAQTGLLFADPASMGFLKQRQRKKRPIPRYMLNQPRLLSNPPFHQVQWDKENQAKMLQMEAANNGSDYQGIYEVFQKMREVERKKMEELGLVDAENIAKDLNDAIFFQGTCLDMCPTFERVRRALENNVKALEKDPSTSRISRDRAVKAFSRPAAGQPPPIPSDVRPPHVLTQTLDYIVDNFLHQLPEAHSFIWDRTRSIRQDFIYQNFYGPEAIDCNERIVRIHLVSLHIMSGLDVEYSQQQELEQFNKALQTLTESYQDVRNHGGTCPNEAEFRAYHLISHFRDPELEREIQLLPDSIMKDPQVQLALRFRNIMSQNNMVERGFVNSVGAMNLFVEFFKLVYSDETPFLMACLLETHFNEIRFYALKAMARSYHTKGKAFLATSLQHMLGFDSIEKLVKFVTYYEVDTINDNGTLLIDLFNKEKLETTYKLNSLHDKPKLSQAYSIQLDLKVQRYSLREFINSGKSNSNLNIKGGNLNQIAPQVTAKPIALIANSTGFGASPTGQTGFGQPSGQTGLGQSSGFGQSSGQQFGFGQSSGQQFGFGQTSGFGQAPAQSPAFGAPPVSQIAPASSGGVGSLNLSDFLKSKQLQSGNAASLFGSSTVPAPAFDFTGKTKAPEKPEPKVEPPQPLKPSLHKESKPREHPPKVSFAEPAEAPKPAFSFPSLPKKEQVKPKVFEFKAEPINKQPSPMPTIEAKPGPVPTKLAPQPKKLKDLPKFPAALDSAYSALLKQVIDSELSRIVPRIIKLENRINEKKRIVDSLTGELYQAFLSELTHQSLLTIVADNLYRRTLLKKTIKKLKNLGEKLKAKHDTKRRNMEELNSISFRVPTLKRRISTSASSSNNSFVKRKALHVRNTSGYAQMTEKQEEIQKLWKPLDLQEFARTCCTNVKIGLDIVAIKSLFVVENWSSPYSKWLNTKFSLRLSSDKTFYENKVRSEKMEITFESLPKDNSLKEDSFRNTCFIVFECGFFHEAQISSHPSLQSKLARDCGVLQKIAQICDRFCLYKVQILVLFWDIQNTGLSSEEASSILNVNGLITGDSSVQDVIVCDMSSHQQNVADTLQSGLFKMGLRFHGHLTARGTKKKLKVEKKLEKERREQERSQLVTATTQRVEDTLKTKEATLLRRGRELHKHNYLSKHIGNESTDWSNASFTTAPNTSIANHTLLNLNNSMANDTTMGAKQVSFLGSYGNASILEESTPFGSPGPGFVRPSVPKRVQELRDLTASIRAKYKK